jgi:hypothetical protein
VCVGLDIESCCMLGFRCGFINLKPGLEAFCLKDVRPQVPREDSTVHIDFDSRCPFVQIMIY